MIKGLSNTIQEIRGEGIEPILEFASQTSKDLGIDDYFPEKRRKTVNKRLEDLETQSREDNTCYLTAEEEFKRELNLVHDRILAELKERYETLEILSSDFYFLTGPALKNEPLNVLKRHVADFGLKYSSDVDVVELSNEIETFENQAKELVEKDLEKATPWIC
ncbi:unnamed protein product [Phaedon cochleariae]|uniref:Uncharacterized protein n=1 Tax=Phaedon cochleariae TaxID=80249 RepID=A0A9N9X3Q8_PHACE|nr:unnamed protein product [Phaedon cochleariae]